MAAFLIAILVLLFAACVLFLAAGWRPRASHIVTRDSLNKDFYHQRLAELTQDEDQGVIAERDVMARELQQSLLSDIPPAPDAQSRSSRRWVLLPGIIVLLVVPLVCYLNTGGFVPFSGWLQVQKAYPALRAQVLDPHAKPLTPEQLSRLQLGLRSHLQTEPDNLSDWAMLGRLGMVLNNATTARQAFEHALQLAPNNQVLKQDYAEVLARSGDPQENRQAELVLQDLRKQDPHNARTLSLLAYAAFEQQHYAQAIAAWQTLLNALPADDPRRDNIARSIEQARTDAGQQASQLTVDVTLSSQAENMLPPGGVMYISVTDGMSPVPVAVKRLAAGHFPVSLTLDDSNAMMQGRRLSAQKQIQVRVRISRNGRANPEPGDWFGVSAVVPWDGHQHVTVEINAQQP
ncbi:c-type cytochrome biogenesis protein CcmI [Pantoea sp. SGAir0180]|uniref:c-type cytochrome biogenesis protein CcmI n=1 Tax=Pantoea stewartii TaxID=66269 RepID=UPI0006D16482|nr:c-type cytochrome biogenesis protein CcmI [Pantoea stewartii]